MNTENKIYLKAIGLGAIAGMRSMSAPSILSQELINTKPQVLQNSPLRYLQMKPFSVTLSLLAVCEMVGDKIPGVPDRTDLPSLAMRTASGALVGATVFATAEKDVVKGALLGGLAAVAATYGFFYLRKAVGENTDIPDMALGFIEDAIMLGSGLALMKK